MKKITFKTELLSGHKEYGLRFLSTRAKPGVWDRNHFGEVEKDIPSQEL